MIIMPVAAAQFERRLNLNPGILFLSA